MISLVRGDGAPLPLLNLLHPPEDLKAKPTPEPCFLANVTQTEYLKKKHLKTILVWVQSGAEITQGHLSLQCLSWIKGKYFESPVGAFWWMWELPNLSS